MQLKKLLEQIDGQELLEVKMNGETLYRGDVQKIDRADDLMAELLKSEVVRICGISDGSGGGAIGVEVE